LAQKAPGPVGAGAHPPCPSLTALTCRSRAACAAGWARAAPPRPRSRPRGSEAAAPAGCREGICAARLPCSGRWAKQRDVRASARGTNGGCRRAARLGCPFAAALRPTPACLPARCSIRSASPALPPARAQARRRSAPRAQYQPQPSRPRGRALRPRLNRWPRAFPCRAHARAPASPPRSQHAALRRDPRPARRLPRWRAPTSSS
jgi:hypothetical protein